MHSPSDEELVRRFVTGDREAFAELAARHERRVYNITYRMLGRREDAVDATQDVFLTCIRKLPGFRADAAFTTWLHRVTVNACHDLLRRRKREQPMSGELPEVPVEDDTAAADAAIDVHRALAELPEQFRTVVVLHDLQGIPYEAIADALGAPIGTVKSRLHRGRVMLGKLLRVEQSPGARPSYQESE